ncbi:hypothetical protein [Streptomyces sp. NPDC058548]|uniref:hypothetical protein n=1 Tax=Streptomyces sp. NPDC058548 TaxID=3346545 RepID=UPI0036562243
MDNLTRAAVTAYLRLWVSLHVGLADPHSSEVNLTEVAQEANAAMGAAGVLDMPLPDWLAIVREVVPGFPASSTPAMSAESTGPGPRA